MSCTALMKQAEDCGRFSIPTLNQTGLLNAAFCWTSRCVSSSAKACEVLGRREVALGLRPPADRVHHAGDQAAHAALALGRAELAPEVLGGDDVRRGLAPGARDLDAVLLEDRLALLVVDDRGAQLPGHLVVRVSSRLREVPPETQTRSLLRVRRGAGLASRVLHGMGRHQGYLTLRDAAVLLQGDGSPVTGDPSASPPGAVIVPKCGDRDYREAPLESQGKKHNRLWARPHRHHYVAVQRVTATGTSSDWAFSAIERCVSGATQLPLYFVFIASYDALPLCGIGSGRSITRLHDRKWTTLPPPARAAYDPRTADR